MKTVLLFIFPLIFWSQYLKAQTTAIPDTKFEQKLIQLGIDSDGTVNGQVLNSDAAAVTNLEVGSSLITDLTGIHAFINLDSLDCSSNQLTSLDISNLTALTYLHCGGNNLTALDITNNTALSILFCYGNSFNSLDLTNNTALTYLLCPGSNLNSLDVSNNLALEILSCGSNNFTSIDVSNNLQLRVLSCNYNASLTSLDVTNNIALESLMFNECNLSTIDVSNNPALRTLHLVDNNFTTIDVSNNPVLESFVYDSNNITAIDLSNNPGLTGLGCEGNGISQLDLSHNPNLGGLRCKNNNLSSLDVSFNPKLEFIYCENNQLSSLDLTNNLVFNLLGCENNDPYMKICITHAQITINNTIVYKDSSAAIVEDCYPPATRGKIVIDANQNCLADSLEQGLVGQVVRCERVSDGAVSYFITYDTLGNYSTYLDTGTYTVTVIPSNNYWQVCPASQQLIVDTSSVIDTMNWVLEPVVTCPSMTVDIAAPFLRMTGGGSPYTVYYCNTGTVAAQNAYVEVDIDAGLNVTGSTMPIASQNGNVYTFNLGTVGIGECGSFNIQVVVDTSAQFEQTHCTEVHIYPDTICDPNWNGPRLDGAADCQNGMVVFTVENIGSAMLQPQAYTIFEDNIAMRTGTVQLGAGQSTTIPQTAAVGSAYRIEVLQAPGFLSIMGNLVFSRAIEGCNPFPDGSFNTGYITQFSNGHSAPFMAIDCQENIASYDPNDKSAQPLGYGAQHLLEQNIAIDYKIRFQNTGTDTAFNIVILDTLSPYLDVSTLKMGASSHSYDWEILSGNVLKVSFPNIMLVDSNANEPLSHGFFRYRIEQQVNNPFGTVINNSASIYFDYNPPIITNTTWHTIGENFVTVDVEKVHQDDAEVRVYPNPFTVSTTIEVMGGQYDELELEVFDLTGRFVKRVKSANNKLELNRTELNTGMYIYRLNSKDVRINTGKLIVK